LDELCRHFEDLKNSGKTRPDASLGIIKNQKVADRLKEAGCECYNHNLESSRRFFPEVCTTHTYDERVQTIQHLKNAGIKICSGGILGMGETAPTVVNWPSRSKNWEPTSFRLNFLNPIPGTPFGKNESLPPMEILKSIACFPFYFAAAGNKNRGRPHGEFARSAKFDFHGRG